MGQYHFAIPDSDRFAEESMMAAQIIGLDGIPWPCKTSVQDGVLTIFRNLDLSGRLLVPFRSTRLGQLFLTTGTLPEAEEAYLLDLEVARGGLSRLRNQVSIWREGGLNIPDDYDQRLLAVIAEFSSAVFLKDDAPQRLSTCISVIDQTVDLMFEITNQFSHQLALIHKSQVQNVPVIAGSVQDSLEFYHENNGIPYPIQRMSHPALKNTSDEGFDFSKTSSVIDWATEPSATSVRVVGPLIQFDNTSLPPWIPEDANFETRLNCVKRMCREFGAEFHKRIKILHVASGISGVGHQHFNYPQQLQMTLEMLETLDQAMPSSSMMVSFDQPWGERLSMATGGVQSMEIADALLRYGARVSAIGLEFNLDYWPQGTLMRDPLQWVDLIDRWSQFGLPLAIYLTVPTGNADVAPASRFLQTMCCSTGDNGYRQYVTTIFNLLIRRPSVNVVAWRRTRDSDNRRFPLSGLIDELGEEKEVFDWFGQLVRSVAASSPKGDETQSMH